LCSGAELLAATRAASGKNLAAANSSPTGAEAVATGANKAAGLERTLHFKTSGISNKKAARKGGWNTEAGR